ncbi:MAG: peroxidase [Fuerstia sp.]|nr:peroxidase [Fuerstiella sp.]
MPLHSRKSNCRRQSGWSVSGLFTMAEGVESRVLLSAAPIDGTGNNLQNPEWGSVGTDLLRLASAEYADAISSVGGEDRPSARLISNTVSDSADQDIISDRMLSAMIYAWGQFIDHDMTLTESGSTERMSISVPTGDPSFDPTATGTATIKTMRSAFDPATGTDAANPRQQVNQITAFLDGSMIYGSDTGTAAALRTFSGGRMKTSDGNLLPLNNAATFPDGTLTMGNANPFISSDQLFAAGDERANENVELTALQTLFVREHNLQASRIAAENPRLTDEQIYQKARSIVIAEIQAITYNEWLPSLLGRGAIDKYTGYDASVNPGISNEFATAAFRFGHSLLGDDVEFLDNNGLAVRDGVELSQAFFNPDLVQETGIDSILKYLSADPSSEVDTKVVDSIRNFLFGPPGAGGLDLASLNIQRGRDHGLADYNTTRAAVGLPRVTTFSQITSDKELQSKLQSLYGTVDNIDLWVGGLAEDHVRGSSVGATFQAIIVDQFERLRDGDRYWYENQFTGRQLGDLQRTSLSDIIERNTSLTSIQQNAFFFKAEISGTINDDRNRDGKVSRDEPPLAGARVQPLNSLDGSVVATATSDRQGRYAFGIADGLRTGKYQVQVMNADGKSRAASGQVSITGGDDFERINLAVPGATTPRPVPTTTPGPRPQMVRSQTPPQLTAPTHRTESVKGQLRPAEPPRKNAPAANVASTTARSPQGEASRLTSTELHALMDSLFSTLPPGLL